MGTNLTVIIYFNRIMVVVMEINQLKPAEIIRDEMGTWSHPDYLAYLVKYHSDEEVISSEAWGAMLDHFNGETVIFYLESSVSSDDWEIMMDNCDITKWDPIAPNGFFLIDIAFSEDDAYALFARKIRKVEVV